MSWQLKLRVEGDVKNFVCLLRYVKGCKVEPAQEVEEEEGECTARFETKEDAVYAARLFHHLPFNGRAVKVVGLTDGEGKAVDPLEKTRGLFKPAYLDFIAKELSESLSEEYRIMLARVREHRLRLFCFLSSMPVEGLSYADHTALLNSTRGKKIIGMRRRALFVITNAAWEKSELMEWGNGGFGAKFDEWSKLTEANAYDIIKRYLKNYNEEISKVEMPEVRSTCPLFDFVAANEGRLVELIPMIFFGRLGKENEVLQMLTENPHFQESYKVVMEGLQPAVEQFAKRIEYMVGGLPISKEGIERMKEKYMAGYLYLGQSSCSGKTKFLYAEKATTKVGIVNVVVNCRIFQSSGYPVSDDVDFPFVNRICSLTSVEHMKPLLSMLLLMCRRKLFSSQHQVGCPGGGDCKCTFVPNPGITCKGYSLKQTGVTFNELVKEPNKEELIELGHLKRLETPDGRPIVFMVSFDEAARLTSTAFPDERVDPAASKMVYNINTFRLIRRILKEEAADFWCSPFVFTDTSTNLANFMPSTLHDPSARSDVHHMTDADYLLSKRSLFEPFLLPHFYDVYQDRVTPICDWIERPYEYILSDYWLVDLTFLGRPIWGAVTVGALAFDQKHMQDVGSAPPTEGAFGMTLTDSQSTRFVSSLKAMLGLAVKKLDLNVLPFLDYCKLDESGKTDCVSSAFACAFLVLGIYRIGARDHSYHLVQKRMATIFAYEYDYSLQYVTYPDEPILACAAYDFFMKHADIVMEIVLLGSNGAMVNVGDIGEFVARTLLVLATLPGRSGAGRTKTPIEYIPRALKCRDYLKCILGKPVEELFGAPDEATETTEITETANTAMQEEGASRKRFRQADRVEGLTQDLARILDGEVLLTHFYTPTDDFAENPQMHVALGLQTASGLQLPPTFAGIDLAIPVLLGPGEGLGSITVQVKNQKDSIGPAAAQKLFEAMMAQDKMVTPEMPTLPIVMNVSSASQSKLELVEFEWNYEVSGQARSKTMQGILIQSLRGPDQFKEVFEQFPRLRETLRCLADVTRFYRPTEGKMIEVPVPGATTTKRLSRTRRRRN